MAAAAPPLPAAPRPPCSRTRAPLRRQSGLVFRDAGDAADAAPADIDEGCRCQPEPPAHVPRLALAVIVATAAAGDCAAIASHGSAAIISHEASLSPRFYRGIDN